MSILMRVRLVFCGVAMKIPPAQIRHMKMPHNSMQMWNMALTVIILFPPPLDAAYAENLPSTFVCHDTSKWGSPPHNDEKQESVSEYPCLCHTGYHIVCAFECGEGD